MLTSNRAYQHVKIMSIGSGKINIKGVGIKSLNSSLYETSYIKITM